MGVHALPTQVSRCLDGWLFGVFYKASRKCISQHDLLSALVQSLNLKRFAVQTACTTICTTRNCSPQIDSEHRRFRNLEFKVDMSNRLKSIWQELNEAGTLFRLETCKHSLKSLQGERVVCERLIHAKLLTSSIEVQALPTDFGVFERNFLVKNKPQNRVHILIERF